MPPTPRAPEMHSTPVGAATQNPTANFTGGYHLGATAEPEVRDSTPRDHVGVGGGKRKLNMSALSDSILSAPTAMSSASDDISGALSAFDSIRAHDSGAPGPPLSPFDLTSTPVDYTSTMYPYATAGMHVPAPPAFPEVGNVEFGSWQPSSSIDDDELMHYTGPQLSHDLPSSNVRLSHGSEFNIPAGAAPPNMWDTTSDDTAEPSLGTSSSHMSHVDSSLLPHHHARHLHVDNSDDAAATTLSQGVPNATYAPTPMMGAPFQDGHAVAPSGYGLFRGATAASLGPVAAAHAMESPAPGGTIVTRFPMSEPLPRYRQVEEASYSRYGRLLTSRVPTVDLGSPKQGSTKGTPKKTSRGKGRADGAPRTPRTPLNTLSRSEADRPVSERGLAAAKTTPSVLPAAVAMPTESPARQKRESRMPKSASKAGVSTVPPPEQPWLNIGRLP
jgi:hypothetical protein